MNTEKKLSEQLKEYQDLGKENKQIDVADLMLNALENHSTKLVSAKEKHWAYVVSIGLPPLGLLWALKFFFSDEDDAKTTAWACVGLTVAALFFAWLMFKMFFNSSGGVNPQQLMQLKPQDVIDLTK